jgi:hypothetical protein
MKAAEDSRTPRRWRVLSHAILSARSWSAAVLCRFTETCDPTPSLNHTITCGIFLALLIPTLRAGAAEKLQIVRSMEYAGLRDASAAVAVSSNLFIVADDEKNTLRLYSTDRAGPALKEFDFDAFLEVTRKSPEADLEGAALLGNRAYWIGSHGRNKDGKERPNRRRLFATDIAITNGEVTLTPVGKPCKRLLDDLVRDSRFAEFRLAEASTRPPKESDALNIEGLSATPEGHLLLGFRNPTPHGKALLIPLLNPNEVIEGKPARFDAAILLDLDGLGVRDMAYFDGAYFIIAGPWHAGGKFEFYRWAGSSSPPQKYAVKHLGDYHPEAIVIYPQTGFHEIQILSDDGNRAVNGVPGKELGDSAPKMFRSFWLTDR